MSITREFAREVLARKEENIYRKRHIVVPEDFDCESAIYEARGHGISHHVFFDSSDKLVLFPSDIGYAHAYNSSSFGWVDSSGWDHKMSTEEDRREACRVLFALADMLRQSGKVQTEIVSVSGSCKGYLMGITRYQEQTQNDYDDLLSEDFALWIWTRQDDLQQFVQINNQ